jgi:mRNA-degrading endonuclease RelE of RelBE toxin-antitoxin system
MAFQIHFSPEFKRAYKKLSKNLQTILKAKGRLFAENPFYPLLHTHKLGGSLSGVWSFSVDYQRRVMFRFLTDQDILLLLVGDHSMYRKKRD